MLLRRCMWDRQTLIACLEADLLQETPRDQLCRCSRFGSHRPAHLAREAICLYQHQPRLAVLYPRRDIFKLSPLFWSRLTSFEIPLPLKVRLPVLEIQAAPEYWKPTVFDKPACKLKGICVASDWNRLKWNPFKKVKIWPKSPARLNCSIISDLDDPAPLCLERMGSKF